MPSIQIDSLDQVSLSDFARFDETRPISLREAFQVGLHLEYLRNAAQENHQIGTVEDNKIAGTLVDCSQLLRRSTLDTSVTNQIMTFVEDQLNNYDATEEIGEEDATQLEQRAVTWQRVLREDLEREQRIPVDDTGLLDVDGLLNNPEKLFSKPVWNWLDDRPREDIKEACKTLVIGCHTSSVFLSLRAVEHCLGQWYESEMDEQISQKGWGAVLGLLIEEFLADSDSNDVLEQLGELPPVLSNLYYLKEKRNEVNHPEKSPNAQEARRTLLNVGSTITDIYYEMAEFHTIEYDNTEMKIQYYEDKEEMILQLIDLIDQGEGAREEAIFNAARELGLDVDATEEHIRDLAMAGRVYEPKANLWRAI